MRQQLLAGVMALALGAGMTTSAMAFDHDSGFHNGRFEGVRGYAGWRRGEWGSGRFVGSYGRYGDYDYGRSATYCPALSRCGAGLPN